MYTKKDLETNLVTYKEELGNDSLTWNAAYQKALDIIDQYEDNTKGESKLDDQDITLCFALFSFDRDSYIRQRSSSKELGIANLLDMVEASLTMLHGKYFDRTGIPDMD